MKPRADQGVVDARLNVYGVTNLKVADLSIVPKNVGTNTYSTALLIGEKAAMIIADELGIECKPHSESSGESPRSRL
jgi:alcohol oxidase